MSNNSNTLADPGGFNLQQPASIATHKRWKHATEQFSWTDNQAFDDANRGKLATIEPPIIRDASGNTLWDLTEWSFVEGPAEDTVHPSLWRAARLSQIHGLFEVTERVYQVRGYDAANMTIVVGEHGYIVIDPLNCTETSSAAIKLVRDTLGDRPVTAIVITHCHGDHFLGVKGVVDEADVKAGKVPLVAPLGFYEHAVEGPVAAPTIMARRSGFMFAGRLPRGPRGHCTVGMSAGLAIGTATLIEPTVTIDTTGQELILDGVRFVFQHAPNTEAPAEMNFYLPEFRALCMAETVTHQLHHIYTLRGAPIRDARGWSAAIDEALTLFGDVTEVVFHGHHWPTWGQERIATLMAQHRDIYRYIHDETLRLANHGFTPLEIAEMIELPDSLEASLDIRGNYGTVQHNAKGVYQYYLGWFDGNPANLNPVIPSEAGRRYVEAFGGIQATLELARSAAMKGDYRWAAEVLKHAIAADPDNREVRHAQADVFEQLGYQAESASWRNFYLVGAKELRLGEPAGRVGGATAPDVVAGMTVDMLIDHMAVRLNGPLAGRTPLSIGLHLADTQPDSSDSVLSVENGTLRRLAPGSDAPTTLRTTKRTFAELAFGTIGLDVAIESAAATVDGNPDDIERLFGLMDTFTGAFSLVAPNLG
ncbi:alkyl/aryl-sulfatase [Rhodococcus sp. NPDC055024]